MILESQGLLAFLVVFLMGDRPAPCSCRAPQAPRAPRGLQAPSAAPARSSSATSRITCRVTALGLTSLEFRAPLAHPGPQGQ